MGRVDRKMWNVKPTRDGKTWRYGKPSGRGGGRRGKPQETRGSYRCTGSSRSVSHHVPSQRNQDGGGAEGTGAVCVSGGEGDNRGAS